MNKKNTRQKENKGITLIALVITIIVMLILVAVTISMAVNGGLFDQAGKASGQTKNALSAEQALAEDGRIKVGDKWYASIDAYINKTPIDFKVSIEETLKLEIEAGYDAETSTPVTQKLNPVLNELNGELTWTSSDNAVATVDQEGVVTAVSAGQAKIMVSISFDGQTYSDECTVTIEELPPSQVGKCIDIEGDGTIDGLIFADLAVGGRGEVYGIPYEIPRGTSFKNYLVTGEERPVTGAPVVDVLTPDGSR